MRGINLLPWREELREERKKEFLIMLGLVGALAVVLLIFIHMVISGFITDQVNANTYIEQQITELNKEIKEVADLKKQKQLMVDRMQLIQRLGESRPQIVSLFNLITSVIPNGVFLNSVKREGPLVTLIGKAQSNTLISDLMRNIEKYSWVDAPVLTEIKSDDADADFSKVFTLQFRLKSDFGQSDTGVKHGR